jgi:hypothetical protein
VEACFGPGTQRAVRLSIRKCLGHPLALLGGSIHPSTRIFFPTILRQRTRRELVLYSTPPVEDMQASIPRAGLFSYGT